MTTSYMHEHFKERLGQIVTTVSRVLSIPRKIDRPGIYAALQVAEVWRFDGKALVIEQLGPDGKYLPAESSRFLPLRADDVLRWLIAEDSGDEVAWEQRLEEWAMSLRQG